MGRWERTPEQDRDIQSRGIDSDLDAAMEYNPQPYQPEDIERVLACVPGERDERNWHWIIELKEARVIKDFQGRDVSCKFVYATGGCDYTGWD